jgi:hypothetical protein
VDEFVSLVGDAFDVRDLKILNLHDRSSAHDLNVFGNAKEIEKLCCRFLHVSENDLRSAAAGSIDDP